MNNKATNKNMT